MTRTLGIIDGGQLARMTCEEARRMAIPTVVFTNDRHSCATSVADKIIFGPYTNHTLLRDFKRAIGDGGVVTCEFENVHVDPLIYLASIGVPVRPNPTIHGIAQHRLEEKNLARSLGIPTTEYISVREFFASMNPGETYFPGKVKTCSGGYDGKDQRDVVSREDVLASWQKAREPDWILERYVKFDYEISATVARNEVGQELVFPPVVNTHRDGILRETHYKDGLIPERIKNQAIEATLKIARHFKLIGILSVEFFVKDDRVLFNEMAARPHNSAHWTIDGCATSQFKALILAVFSLPFPASVGPVAEARMINLIGDEIGYADQYKTEQGWTVHRYGKTFAKPGRKMGHATLTKKRKVIA